MLTTTTHTPLSQCPTCSHAIRTQSVRVSKDGNSWSIRYIHQCTRQGTAAKPTCFTAIQDEGVPVRLVAPVAIHRRRQTAAVSAAE